MRNPRPWLAAFFLIVSLAGCSIGGDTRNDRSEETSQEILDANAAYLSALTLQVGSATWPPGFLASAEGIYQRSVADDMFIADPEGFAAGAVSFFRQCAWSMAWLDANATGDAGRADAAMDVLLDPSLYAEVDPESREYLLGLARTAQLGDPTGLQNVVDQSCLPDDWLERS